MPGGTGCAGGNAASFNCTPDAAGTYAVDLTVRDSNGENATAGSLMVVVSPALVASGVTASASSATVGGIVVFSVGVSGGSGRDSYLWTGLPGGCASANGPSVACSPSSSAGSPFTVSVAVKDSNDGSATATSSPVQVTAATSPGTTSGTNLTGGDWAAIGLALVALVIAAVAIVLSGRRKGGGGSTSLPPPAAAGGGPPPTPWAEPPAPAGTPPPPGH